MKPRLERSGLTPFGRKGLGCHTLAFCSRGCTSPFTTLKAMIDDGQQTHWREREREREREISPHWRIADHEPLLRSHCSPRCWSVVGCVQQRRTLGPNWPSDARRRRKDRGCPKICPSDLRSSTNTIEEISLIGLEVNQPLKDLQEIEEFGREVRTPVGRDHVIQLRGSPAAWASLSVLEPPLAHLPAGDLVCPDLWRHPLYPARANLPRLRVRIVCDGRGHAGLGVRDFRHDSWSALPWQSRRSFRSTCSRVEEPLTIGVQPQHLASQS